MKTKILILLIILCLSFGVVYAVDIDAFKTPDDFKDFQDGCAAYDSNPGVMLYVEKAGDTYKQDWFTNASDLTVSEVNDTHIFYYESDSMWMYGYQEIIDIDGDVYLVSINQDSELSPGEKDLYLEDLIKFNELNNLEPIAV